MVIQMSSHYLLKSPLSSLSDLSTLIENHLTLDVCVYFWTINFISNLYVYLYANTTFWCVFREWLKDIFNTERRRSQTSVHKRQIIWLWWKLNKKVSCRKKSLWRTYIKFYVVIATMETRIGITIWILDWESYI